MMKKKEIKKIAKQILEQEKIIADENSLGNSVKSAKEKIEYIMSTLNFEELLQVDDYIMNRKIRTS